LTFCRQKLPPAKKSSKVKKNKMSIIFIMYMLHTIIAYVYDGGGTAVILIRVRALYVNVRYSDIHNRW